MIIMPALTPAPAPIRRRGRPAVTVTAIRKAATTGAEQAVRAPFALAAIAAAGGLP